MKDYAKYAISAALGGVIVKMSYFIWLAPDSDWDMYVRFAYLLLFLVALFLGLRTFKLNNAQTDFTTDVKTGMKIASLFAIIISGFTFVYYKWINAPYFAKMIRERVDQAPPDLVEGVRANSEFFFSAFTHSTITLFGIMVIGFFYTLVLVLIMRAKPDVFNR